MALNYVDGVPGIRSDREATPREVLLGVDGALYLPTGKILSGTYARDPLNTGDLDVLRAGMLVGKRTSGSKYAPAIIGVTTVAYDQDGTNHLTLTVSAATAVELVRRIGTTGSFKLTGPPSAAGTVATQTVTYSAVNVTTGVITISDLSADAISGSFIQPADGSETILGLIVEQYGIKVTDVDSDNIDVPLAKLLIGGVVDASQIVNYPSDTSLIAWIKTALRAVGTGFVFDDDF